MGHWTEERKWVPNHHPMCSPKSSFVYEQNATEGSLFSIINEFNDIMSTNFVSDDGLLKVCDQLEQIWKAQIEGGLVMCRIYYTDHLLNHEKQV